MGSSLPRGQFVYGFLSISTELSASSHRTDKALHATPLGNGSIDYVNRFGNLGNVYQCQIVIYGSLIVLNVCLDQVGGSELGMIV